MIDYRTHAVAMADFQSTLADEVFADPGAAAAGDDLLTAASTDRGLATLGSLIDHLLRHSASDGAELALLERGGALWQSGLAPSSCRDCP